MINSFKQLNSWLFNLDNWKKRWIKITFDTVIVPVSLLMAFTVRLENFDFLYLSDFYLSCAIAATSAVLIFAKCGLYSAFTRHVSIEVAITILSGSFGSAMILFIGKYLGNIWIPISVPFIYVAFLCLIATSVRFIMRALGQSLNEEVRENVVIYGAGAAGTQLMEALKSNPSYRVCQFIDDDAELLGRTIAGIPIENFDKAKKKFKHLEVNTLLLAMASTSDQVRQKVSDLVSEQQLNVKTIPSITSLISGVTDITELQDINIEDLLGRDPVQPDATLLSKSITGKVVLVTGAGGSIGSELCRQIVNKSPKELILLDISEASIYFLLNELTKTSSNNAHKITPLIGSVQNKEFVLNVLNTFSIDTIFHAAAYKHVPLMEMNVMQCFENNVLGTYNLADCALKSNVDRFILISTDKAVNPTNFMGASKRFAELICQSMANKKASTKFSMVRFGNVLGSSGSVVPLFKQQIESNETITITHKDTTRYFMTIPEAAQLVIQAGAMAKGGEVFVLDMGKPIKIIDLARKMIWLSGLNPVESNDAAVNKNDRRIKVIGLRPGEKLHEELAYNKQLIKTRHPRIMKANEEYVAADGFESLLFKIHKSVRNQDYLTFNETVLSVIPTLDYPTASSDIFLRSKQH